MTKFEKSFTQQEAIPEEAILARADQDDLEAPWRVWVSARDGLGLDLLQDALRQRFC